jgi:hypothetical protein
VTGVTGATGVTGPTGYSQWSFTGAGGAIYYPNSVGIGTVSPTVNTLLDVSGSSLFSSVQERIQTASVASMTGNVLNLNYANGAIMVLPNTMSVASNYILNITGIPPSVVGDVTKTYVVTVINTTEGVTTLPNNSIIANVVNINGTTLPGTMVFAGGVIGLPTTTSTYLIQQIALITVNGTQTIAMSSVSQYS